MNEKAYNELLLEHYKYRQEAENLDKETFLKLYCKAYEKEISQIELAASKCWEAFSNSDLLGKIKFIMDHYCFATFFETYCMGFKEGHLKGYEEGCDDSYNND